MNTKQLLCLLVLAISGNTFGSAVNGTSQMPVPIGAIAPTPPPMPMEMITMKIATNHFAGLEQGMPETLTKELKRMGMSLRWSTDVIDEVIMHIRTAHQQGIVDGLTAAGKYLQPGLTAMGEVIAKEQKNINAMTTAKK